MTDTVSTVPTLLSTNPAELIFQLRGQETAPQDLYILPPGSRHFSEGAVLRYMLRYGRDDGLGFVHARQGRFTHATLRDATQALQSLTRNNSDSNLALYGGAKALFTGFTACYAGHYDPAPIDLGSTLQCPASLQSIKTLKVLATAIARARFDYP